MHVRDAFRAVLQQHVAILGKTGSGKSSTAKLAIEQVVADGARVCVLDPLKSDWWGLTSSADGQRPGLPFHILGGPRGHVPLHSSAGKAIAEIVANGTLRLSILDMADFEPGGHARFFVDFAATLLKRMRGVVYLVLEESHIFAPKERSGIGAETMAIHWAKTLATAGRSKGVRLVLVTQRTQALHNALLGSCDTVIAHRLTAPADQDPVVRWLKANAAKDVVDRVSRELSSLKTGHGWICSGEAKLFEPVHFPRITTYDNTATPTGDGELVDVTTAPVDQAQLRALIGEAVAQAAADDPKALRTRVTELETELAKFRKMETPAPARVEVPVLSATDLATLEALVQRVEKVARLQQEDATALEIAIRAASDTLARVQRTAREMLARPTTGTTRLLVPPASAPERRQQPQAVRAPAAHLDGAQQKILDTVLMLEARGLTPTREMVARWMSIHPKGGRYGSNLAFLRAHGYLDGLTLTPTGISAARQSPSGLEGVRAPLDGAQRAMVDVLDLNRGKHFSRETLAQALGIHPKGGRFGSNLARLRTMGLIPERGAIYLTEAAYR